MKTYAVQVFGSNKIGSKPHWMTICRRSSKEKAEAEVEFFRKQGSKDIRIIKI